MRILNIMMGTGDGGLERAALDAHEALSLAGCDVTTILNSRGKMSARFHSGQHVIQLTSLFSHDVFAKALLRWKVRDREFDLILAHGNRAVYLAQSIKKRAPLVLACHTTNYSARNMINLIDGAIVLTKHYASVMTNAGMPDERIRLVPNAIRIRDEPVNHPVRSRPLIGGLGRLVPNKGFDLLLEALAELKREKIPFQCIIHGTQEDGKHDVFHALRDRLDLTEDDVSFPGWTGNAEQFLRTLDIFCMPSRKEVLSIALLEALAAGRAIICSKIPGYEEIIEHGKNGFFININNVAELTSALKILLHDPSLRESLGKAARESSHRFDISVVGKELRAALEDLLTRPNYNAP